MIFDRLLALNNIDIGIIFKIILLFLALMEQAWSAKEIQEVTLNASLFKHAKQFHGLYIQDYPLEKRKYYGQFLLDLIQRSLHCKRIKIICTDHFEIELDIKKINNCKKEKACPAILIDKDHNWPKQSKYGPYVGPFYLSWIGKNSKAIPREMWGWNVQKIKCAIETNKQELTKAEEQGREIFIKNCNGCHNTGKDQINKLGTNLIYPLSPLEYFKTEELFKKFVRNPQSIRLLNKDRMIGFSKDEISNDEIEKLILYLKKLIRNRKN